MPQERNRELMYSTTWISRSQRNGRKRSSGTCPGSKKRGAMTLIQTGSCCLIRLMTEAVIDWTSIDWTSTAPWFLIILLLSNYLYYIGTIWSSLFYDFSLGYLTSFCLTISTVILFFFFCHFIIHNVAFQLHSHYFNYFNNLSISFRWH